MPETTTTLFPSAMSFPALSQNGGSPVRDGVPGINRRLRTAQSVSWTTARPAHGPISRSGVAGEKTTHALVTSTAMTVQLTATAAIGDAARRTSPFAVFIPGGSFHKMAQCGTYRA